MDRATHRAMVEAGMMPLADYVKQYGDDQPELPFTAKDFLGGFNCKAKSIDTDKQGVTNV